MKKLEVLILFTLVIVARAHPALAACGDIYPRGTSGKMDCGDGIVNSNDVLEASLFLDNRAMPTECQLINGDVPNGTPEFCGYPAGTQNCDTNGVFDVLDYLVIIDKAMGRSNCCDYCLNDIADDDADRDGVSDEHDNCPDNANPSQGDNDLDGRGDVCDLDDDKDTIPDTRDNCPRIYNPGQEDTDSDRIGDSCDPIVNRDVEEPTGGTVLTWNRNSEPDLAGYKLYILSPEYSTTIYGIIDVGNPVNTNDQNSQPSCDLFNTFASSGLFMYEGYIALSLTAYDTSGNESERSASLLFEFADSTPFDEDNCRTVYNPDQKDTYPPGGNGIGDRCDCEGDFTCDGDVDGLDAALIRNNTGRNSFNHPCTIDYPCNGNFDCDGDVDGLDNSLFRADAGRNAFNRPCPPCTVGAWCVYD